MRQPLNWPNVAGIAHNLCDRHRRAINALSAHDDHVRSIESVMTRRPIGATIWRYNTPVVAIGAVVTHPGVASTFMYARDNLRDVIIELTRYIKTELLWGLAQGGIHKVVSLAPADDPTGEQWKAILGGYKEATLYRYGKNGEDFCLYTRFLTR